MDQAMVKNFNHPDESVNMSGHGTKEAVMIDGMPIERAEFLKGWKWSNDVKPMLGTDSCPVHHLGYCLEGHLHVQMDDGSTMEINAGDAFEIPAGHDAWVVGDHKAVMVDFGKAAFNSK